MMVSKPGKVLMTKRTFGRYQLARFTSMIEHLSVFTRYLLFFLLNTALQKLEQLKNINKNLTLF